MSASYRKTVQEFIDDVSNKFESNVINVLKNKVGKHSKAEEDSWRNSLRAIKEILNELPEELKKNCIIGLEENYFDNQRVDVVLLGCSKDGQKRLLLIENKQWGKLKEFEICNDILCMPCYFRKECPNYAAKKCLYPKADRATQCKHYQKIECAHPSQQVYRYKWLLENTNKYIQEHHVEIDALVYMHNATQKDDAGFGPLASDFNEYLALAKIYTKDEEDTGDKKHALVKKLENYFDGSVILSVKDLDAIYDSEHCFSADYKDKLQKLFDNKELQDILDEEQYIIFNKIINKIKECKEQNKKAVFVIEGKPGTGKTYIALALLAYLYKKNSDKVDVTRYVARNRDFRKTIIFQLAPPEGSIKSTDILQLEQYEQDNSMDCLICDETHRFSEELKYKKKTKKFIETTINAARVAVYFYDTRQNIHVKDFVTKEVIEDKIVKFNKDKHIIDYEYLSLKNQHRSYPAVEFLDLMDKIIYNEETDETVLKGTKLDSNFEVKLFNNTDDLFRVIQAKDGYGIRKAPFSRVLSGIAWPRDKSNKDKIIGPLRNSTEKYKWGFDYEDYYQNRPFAIALGGHYHVGCVMNIQGLDLDYVGVILAKGIVYDEKNHCVKVDINGHDKDDKLLRGASAAKCEDLIKNAYHVLLSRGIHGAYIYCQDQALHDYLKKFLPEYKSGS